MFHDVASRYNNELTYLYETVSFSVDFSCSAAAALRRDGETARNLKISQYSQHTCEEQGAHGCVRKCCGFGKFYFISHQHYNTSRSLNLYCSTIRAVITSDSSFFHWELRLRIQYIYTVRFVLLFVLFCTVVLQGFLILPGIYRTKLFTIAFCFATATTQHICYPDG